MFHAWFHNSFIPKELSSLGLEPKAVLVLDNCPSHPNEEDLISDDENITALYLPPNVTSLIQPMDRSRGACGTQAPVQEEIVTQAIDRRREWPISYELLEVSEYKNCHKAIAESWGEIKESMLHKSWGKIMPIQEPKESKDQI